MFLKRRSAPAARTRDASRADAVSLTPPPGLAVVRCSRSHACNVASVSGGGAAGSSHCCGWFGWLGCHPHGTKLAVKNSMARRRCCRHAFGRACSQRLHLGHTWCVAERRPRRRFSSAVLRARPSARHSHTSSSSAGSHGSPSNCGGNPRRRFAQAGHDGAATSGVEATAMERSRSLPSEKWVSVAKLTGLPWAWPWVSPPNDLL